MSHDVGGGVSGGKIETHRPTEWVQPWLIKVTAVREAAGRVGENLAPTLGRGRGGEETRAAVRDGGRMCGRLVK